MGRIICRINVRYQLELNNFNAAMQNQSYTNDAKNVPQRCRDHCGTHNEELLANFPEQLPKI